LLGFRIDTLKHVPVEEARRFVGQIREYAADLGKRDFFLVGEIAGSDIDANHLRYVLMCNLSAGCEPLRMNGWLNASENYKSRLRRSPLPTVPRCHIAKANKKSGCGMKKGYTAYKTSRKSSVICFDVLREIRSRWVSGT
jgi:hypothetical protein